MIDTKLLKSILPADLYCYIDASILLCLYMLVLYYITSIEAIASDRHGNTAPLRLV